MLFGRVYELVIGKGSDAFRIDGLRVTFDIKADTEKQANTGTIKVYNLASETRKTIEQPGVTCELKAGYAEEHGPVRIFVGEVELAFSTREGSDIVTTIELADGVGAMRNTLASASYSAGVSTETILRDTAASMGLGISISTDVIHKAYPSKFAHQGAARNVLSKVCASIGATWSVQSGQIKVIKAGKPMAGTAYVFNADSGLVGSPVRQKEARESAGKTTDVVTVKQKGAWLIETLLCPYLVPGDAVKVESQALNKFCLVESVQHSGDSHGGSWTTQAKVVEYAA